MRAPDTSPAAHRAQLDVLRRLTGSQRVALALDLSEATREIAACGIRSRHPEYDERAVKVALMRLLYPDELPPRAQREPPTPP